MDGESRAILLEDIQGWQLLEAQGEVIGSDARRLGLAGGRGYGKSLSAGLFSFAEVLFNPSGEKRTAWVVAESYDKTAYVYDYLLNELRAFYGQDWKLWAKSKPSKPIRDSWTIELLNGWVIKTRSFGSPESLHQEDVDLLIIDEVGLLSRYLWENRLLSSALKTPGSIVLIVGTWEEATGTLQKELYEDSKVSDDWTFRLAPSWDNIHRWPLGIDDPEIQRAKRELSPEVFLERFGAVPQVPSGLVYHEFDMKRHCGDYPYIAGEPVQLWVDPGTVIYCVLAVQKRGDCFYIVDEIYEENQSTEGIKDIAAAKAWLRGVGGGAIDNAAREPQMIWQSEKVGGFSVHLRKRPIRVLAGIERVRTYLFSQDFKDDDPTLFEHRAQRGIPKLFIHKDCRNTIKEFRSYRWPKDTPRRGEPRNPVKKDDHALNAIAYGLINDVGFVPRMRRAPTRRRDKYKGFKSPSLKP